MPTLTGQESPLLTHSPPALAAVVILASVALVLMLNQDTLPMAMLLLLMESARLILLDTPTSMLSVASVVLMLMLTTDIPMDMLAVDTMAMVDMAMAVDTTGVNQTKLFSYHHLEI